MDKYEFNLKIDQIKKLVKQKDYAEAARIADEFEEYKIKDNKILTLFADVYEGSGHYEKAKEMLTEAYERVSLGRQISYRLVKLSIKSGQLDEAEEYYEEYVKMAPKDRSKYLLQYHIGKAKGKPIEERIEILKRYLDDEMDEKWSFELARLYHQAGEKSKCIELCDSIILWFNEGKYVEKAMELKMIYTPLSKKQQDMYDERWMAKAVSNINVEDIKIKEVDVKNKYNTVNIQEAIKNSMKKIMSVDGDTKVIEPLKVEEKSNSLLSHTVNIPTYKREDGTYNTIPLDPIFEIDSDGQIGINVEDETLDEQIEGQMTIEEILSAYEERESRLSQMELPEEILEEEMEEEPEIDFQVEEMEEEPEVDFQVDEVEEEPEVDFQVDKLEEEPEVENLRLDLSIGEENLFTPSEDENIELDTDGEKKEELVDDKDSETKDDQERPMANEEIKETLKEFVGKFSGIQGLDKQVLKIMQETVLKNNNKFIMVGEVKCGKTSIAIDLIKIINKVKRVRGRKIAKINGSALNGKDVLSYYSKLDGIDIVIEKVGSMETSTIESLLNCIENDNENKIIIFEDEKSGMDKALENNPVIEKIFVNSIHIKQNKIKDWAQVAKEYAASQGYEIDEMGILALHANIDKLYGITVVIQKCHIEDVINEAIKRSRKKGLGKIMKIFGKTREKVLREEDFS